MAWQRFLVLGFGLALLAAAPARADFKVCNETELPLDLALAHSDGTDWISEGWWMIQPHSCATPLTGPLQARFYYLHAVHYKANGDYNGGWVGDRFFCATRRSFSITGRDKCAERGYERTGFFEVDTQQAADYTHVLSDK